MPRFKTGSSDTPDPDGYSVALKEESWYSDLSGCRGTPDLRFGLPDIPVLVSCPGVPPESGGALVNPGKPPILSFHRDTHPPATVISHSIH
jgi:hypothetical protein